MPAPRQKVPRLHTRARSQRAAGADGGRGGWRRGRGACSCLGAASRRRLGRLLSPGSVAAAAAPALSLSLPRLRLQVRNLAGPCSGGGGARARPSGRRGRAGRAAPRVTRLPGGPSPGGAPGRRRGRGPWGSGRAPGACAGPNPVQGRWPSVPEVWTPRPRRLRDLRRPRGETWPPPPTSLRPSQPGRRAGRRAPKLGEESWRRGGAAHSWRRKGLSFGKRLDDVAGLESGLAGWGRAEGGGGRRGRGRD